MMKRLFCMLLVCVAMFGCLGMEASAIQTVDEAAPALERASGRFSMDVYKNEIVTADTDFPLEIGETVTINAVYSPRSASVDFGLIAPDGLFYPFRAENGRFDKTIEVDQRGYYTFAVRNNSDFDISVSGFVTY